jgi:hypothetical protein
MLEAYWAGVKEAKENRPGVDQVLDSGTYLAILRNFAYEQASKLRGQYEAVEGSKTTQNVNKAEQDLRGAIEGRERIIEEYTDTYQDDSIKARLVGHPVVSTFVYVVVALLIFLGEFPLNLVVFRLFGEADIYNLCVAFGLGALLLWAAHIAGKKLKHAKTTWECWTVIFATLGILLGALVGIGVLRHHYLVRVEGEAPSIEVMYALVTLQFLIFWGALILAYAHHFPADRSKLEECWKHWFDGKVSEEKNQKRALWEVKALANGIDRLKDVYIGANLAHRGIRNHENCPLLFYLIDSDDLVEHRFQRDSGGTP